jgi:hypothetical protein
MLNYHTMQTYKEMEVELHEFLTSANGWDGGTPFVTDLVNTK